jgi:hypothetical protein
MLVGEMRVKGSRKTPAVKTKAAAAKPGAKVKAAGAGGGAEEIPAEFAPVVAAFAGDRQVGRKRMFSSSAVLNVNGKIFAMMVKGKFVVKLPRARVDALVAAGKGEYFDTGAGRLMKEWVAMAGGRAGWVALAQEAYGFVKTGKA